VTDIEQAVDVVVIGLGPAVRKWRPGLPTPG
jgi:hypothetical protein